MNPSKNYKLSYMNPPLKLQAELHEPL
jgi:hypothetical protein